MHPFYDLPSKSNLADRLPYHLVIDIVLPVLSVFGTQMPDTDETFRGPEALVQDLHRDAATICMVTHDPRLAKHAQREVLLFDSPVVQKKN